MLFLGFMFFFMFFFWELFDKDDVFKDMRAHIRTIIQQAKEMLLTTFNKYWR